MKKYIKRNTTNKRNKVVYLDILRVLSSFAVIVLHVSASKWYTISIFSSEWTILTAYDSCVRWAVPAFLMISGAIFLNIRKDISIKKLYTKYLPRMIIIYFVWSLLYNFFLKGSYSKIIDYGFSVEVIKELFFNSLSGWFHLTFLLYLIGLYILIPIFRGFSALPKKQLEYYLLLVLIFSILYFLLKPLLSIYSPLIGSSSILYINKIFELIDKMNISVVCMN